MKRLGIVTISVLAFGFSGRLAFGVNPPNSPDDHFFCYTDKDVSATKFAPQSVTLADQFESGSYSVSKNKGFCTPADKNAEGIVDPNTRLMPYSLKAAGAITPSAASRTGIQVVNQFHPIATPLVIDISKGNLLLVPAYGNVGTNIPPPPPDPQTNNVDNFHCYKAKVSKGQPKFVPITGVSVQTQFEPARTFDLKKISRLCTPVDLNGNGIKNPLGLLLCYKAAPTKGQAKFAPVAVVTNDQFGPRSLNVLKERELCVPSVKN